MNKVIEMFSSWVVKNLKNPKLYIGIIITAIIVFVIYPYIDANFFFYNRIEKRVEILKTLSEIDIEQVNKRIELNSEYHSILEDISKQREWSISDIILSQEHTDTQNTPIIKFIFGAVLPWILAVCSPFMKSVFPTRKERLETFLIFVVMGFIFGVVGFFIPTIIHPLVNYILTPIIEILIFACLDSNKTST